MENSSLVNIRIIQKVKPSENNKITRTEPLKKLNDRKAEQKPY